MNDIDSGTKICAGRSGSLSFEIEDANIYAEWIIDYNCFNNELKSIERYQKIVKLLIRLESLYFIQFVSGVRKKLLHGLKGMEIVEEQLVVLVIIRIQC